VILVDTCVLVDVSTSDSRWGDWSVKQLAHWASLGPVMINPIVFAEWCPDFETLENAETAFDAFGLVWQEMPRAALFLASRAHLQYRRRGGTRPMVLPDFLIGAHAAVARVPLLTRDRRRFDTYFNGLEIVAPDTH
jgi:predicted nucleic acid-binding protein